MKAFAALIEALGRSTKVLDKQAALIQYLNAASDADKLWTIALFTGRRPKRAVNSARMREWAAEVSGIPLWLFEESYQSVGDLGETIALLLPPAEKSSDGSLSEWMDRLAALEQTGEAEKKAAILNAWSELGQMERLVFNKLVGGSFRVGAGEGLLTNALAKAYNLDAQAVAHRLSGNWTPYNTTFSALLTGDHVRTESSKPYPFYLAYALEDDPETLGPPSDWLAEWKWDGIRGQLVKRGGAAYLWSRGEELITEKFPEFTILYQALPDGVVLDGEIMAWRDGRPLPFNALQTRIGRKNVTRKQLEEAPAVFLAYDLLEWNGDDSREKAMAIRRGQLESCAAGLNNAALLLSPKIEFSGWQQLTELRMQAREHGSEGLMLKRLAAPYQAGRRRGDWWKWKLDPFSVDCVLVAAQKGHGRRANIYTDYTFAVRNDQTGELVTFTKAYSGLTDAAFLEVDAWIKKNILEQFGPVRTVKPELVFEIGFEGIAPSKRHKSGVALRFPRMLRRRHDKTIDDINTLSDLKLLLNF